MAAPASPRPEPDAPGPEPAPPRRSFRHVRPVEEEAGEVLRHGRGSGCIPILVIRLSLLALLVFLAAYVAGLVASRQPPQTPPRMQAAAQRAAAQARR